MPVRIGDGNLHFRNTKITEAYLTVYLSLSMAVMLSLCLALIEGVRQNTVYLEAECVTDIGLSSIFAEYHRELLRRYNLFAIDSSYGSDRPEVAKTAKRLEEYLDHNFSVDDVWVKGLLYRDFLKLSSKGAELTKVSFITDGAGAVFRRRAAEAVWEDLNLDLYQELQGWMQVVDANELDTRDIAAEKRELDRELDEYEGTKKQISEKSWVTVTVDNPTRGLETVRAGGILNWVIDDPQSISGKRLDEANLISVRMREGKVNEGNLELEKLSETEQMLENFLFREYLLRYMGYYGVQPEDHALQYQIEYLIAGKDSDPENLKSVVNMICAMREAANTVYLMSDREKCIAAEAMGIALATVMMIPEAADVIKMILLLGWAYAESLYDTECLLAGGKVPLMKTEQTWHYDLDMIFQPGKDEQNLSAQGLAYKDYLRILLMLKGDEILAVRAMNMVEADIRQTAGNAAFRIDGCIDRAEVCVSVQSAYGYDCEITRRKGYSTQ